MYMFVVFPPARIKSLDQSGAIPYIKDLKLVVLVIIKVKF